jgi:hypothetical protein
LQTHFGERLVLLDLFKYPTIGGLARFVEGRVHQGTHSRGVQDRAMRQLQANARQTAAFRKRRGM